MFQCDELCIRCINVKLNTNGIFCDLLLFNFYSIIVIHFMVNNVREVFSAPITALSFINHCFKDFEAVAAVLFCINIRQKQRIMHHTETSCTSYKEINSVA